VRLSAGVGGRGKGLWGTKSLRCAFDRNFSYWVSTRYLHLTNCEVSLYYYYQHF